MLPVSYTLVDIFHVGEYREKIIVQYCISDEEVKEEINVIMLKVDNLLTLFGGGGGEIPTPFIARPNGVATLQNPAVAELIGLRSYCQTLLLRRIMILIGSGFL